MKFYIFILKTKQPALFFIPERSGSLNAELLFMITSPHAGRIRDELIKLSGDMRTLIQKQLLSIPFDFMPSHFQHAPAQASSAPKQSKTGSSGEASALPLPAAYLSQPSVRSPRPTSPVYGPEAQSFSPAHPFQPPVRSPRPTNPVYGPEAQSFSPAHLSQPSVRSPRPTNPVYGPEAQSFSPAHLSQPSVLLPIPTSPVYGPKAQSFSPAHPFQPPVLLPIPTSPVYGPKAQSFSPVQFSLSSMPQFTQNDEDIRFNETEFNEFLATLQEENALAPPNIPQAGVFLAPPISDTRQLATVDLAAARSPVSVSNPVQDDSDYDCDHDSAELDDDEYDDEYDSDDEDKKRKKKNAPPASIHRPKKQAHHVTGSQHSLAMSGNLTCEECGQTCLTQRGLSKHITIQHNKLVNAETESHLYPLGPNRLKCKYCVDDRRFKCMSHLIDHLRTHSVIERLKCSKCPASFAQKIYLTQHIRKYHSE